MPHYRGRRIVATLAGVYDADPAPRRPHDVIATPGGRSDQRPIRPGPHAAAKWLTEVPRSFRTWDPIGLPLERSRVHVEEAVELQS
jgi:hypothetical protein